MFKTKYQKLATKKLNRSCFKLYFVFKFNVFKAKNQKLATKKLN